MKLLLLVAGIVLLQVSGIQSHPHPELYEECAKEQGISEDLIKAGPEANSDKPEFKCVAACVFKKQGELEEGNNFNLDKVRENTPPEISELADGIVGTFEECIETVNAITDECEYANLIKNCLREKLPSCIADF